VQKKELCKINYCIQPLATLLLGSDVVMLRCPRTLSFCQGSGLSPSLPFFRHSTDSILPFHFPMIVRPLLALFLT
jgi:hypothetical protein